MTSTTKRLLRILIATVTVAMATVCPAQAAAPYISNSGAACRPYLGTTTAFVVDYGGFQSTTSGSIDVTCPMNVGTVASANTVGFASVVLYYNDQSTTGAFSCTLSAHYPNGSSNTSAPKYTCSTAGGCADSTTSFSGTGYLQWTSTDLGASAFYVDSSSVIKCTIVQNGGIILSYYSQD
jgi:hypothetical protein